MPRSTQPGRNCTTSKDSDDDDDDDDGELFALKCDFVPTKRIFYMSSAHPPESLQNVPFYNNTRRHIHDEFVHSSIRITTMTEKRMAQQRAFPCLFAGEHGGGGTSKSIINIRTIIIHRFLSVGEKRFSPSLQCYLFSTQSAHPISPGTAVCHMFRLLSWKLCSQPKCLLKFMHIF